MEMMDKHVLAKVAVNIILVMIYGYMFGHHSVMKFLEEAIIVTKKEEYISSNMPLGKMLS